MADDALFDLDPESPENLVAVAKVKRATTLAIAKVLGPGPVYQGVNKQINALTASGKKNAAREQRVDPVEHAGTIAALRALARAIDRATGHNPTGWHANGRDIAPLYERLEQLVRQLVGDDVDALDAWMNDPDAPKEDTRGRAETPHTPI